MGGCEDRCEIAFFDVETTVPTRTGQGYSILEFGSILVCPKKLIELHNYSTLVRPSNLSHISAFSVRCNGITRDDVVSAPAFTDVADKVYDILHGRIWAGHNILKFDCVRIREAFAEINRPAPEPKGTIDTLALLTQRFGRRAGNMKMATLATYFGLGQQTHRSLDDVRMNLEILKYCATVLFLESSLPDVLTAESSVSLNSVTRSRSNAKSNTEGTSPNTSISSTEAMLTISSGSSASSINQSNEENYSVLSHMIRSTEEAITNSLDSSISQADPFDMASLSDDMESESLRPDVTMEEKPILATPQTSSSDVAVEGGHGTSAGFLEPDEICLPSISASLVPFYRGTHKIQLWHKGLPFQLCSNHLKVRFGISTMFVDHAGRPRLNFVVHASPSLCKVLDACNDIAWRLSEESGSSSDWRPVVIRKEGFHDFPTVRLHIPTVVSGDSAMYATEMYQREPSGNIQRFVFSKFDAAELGSLLVPGKFVDAFFSLDPYDYQQNAGIRLVAKKLIIHCN